MEVHITGTEPWYYHHLGDGLSWRSQTLCRNALLREHGLGLATNITSGMERMRLSTKKPDHNLWRESYDLETYTAGSIGICAS